MDTSLDLTTLDQYIEQLSAIETAMNEYRRSGSMEGLYRLQGDAHARPVLQKWLAFADMPELDETLDALNKRNVRMSAFSPYCDIMLHCQKEWERPVEFIHIVYVYRGRFSCKLSDTAFDLKPGWCYMFNVNAAKEILPSSPDAQLLNCLISQHYFENILLQHFDRTVFFSNFLTQAFYTVNSSQPLLTLDTTANPTVRTVFSKAIVEQLNRKPLFETAVNSMICILMVELLRIYMEASNTQHYLELGNNKLSDILNYISAYCSTVTLDQAAEQFHFNPNYLGRIIKHNTGQTFTQVLQATRLKKAARLLSMTDMSISDITHAVGYHNCTHFYKLFRQSYGRSPAEYRAAHKRTPRYQRNS